MKVALLDAYDVYQGVVELENESQRTEHHVNAVPDESIVPGKYRFVRDRSLPEGGIYMAIRSTARRPSNGVPSVEQVLYALAKSHPNPPSEAVAWMRWFEKSYDARK